MSLRTRMNLNVVVLLILWLSLGGGGSIGGASEFIVLHEATKDDEAFSKLATTLQDQESTVGKKIVDSGWKFLVLDDDAKDKNDQPEPLLKSLGVHGSITDAHRELLSVSDKQKLLKRETLPADSTAESVFAMMQARGKRK